MARVQLHLVVLDTNGTPATGALVSVQLGGFDADAYIGPTGGGTTGQPISTVNGRIDAYFDPDVLTVGVDGSPIGQSSYSFQWDAVSAVAGGDLSGNTSSPEVSTVLSGKTPLTADQNLQELTNAATARTNLGLGSAATHASTDFAATSALTGETTRAEAAEATNASAISTETTRAEAAEAANGTAINTETTRAEGAEGALSTAVDVEISRAEAAEALLAPLASPTLTGSPKAPTKAASDNSTNLATTAYADGAVATEASRATAAETLKAPLASPALTGNPTVPTQAALTNSTRAASTAYADGAVALEVARAEAAEALLAPLASPTLTGSPKAPTKAAADNSTNLATTAYADGAIAALLTAAATLTNKRITNRVVAVNAPGATPTINTDNTDVAAFTGLGAAITSMTTNLSGTPAAGDLLVIEFTDGGVARALTFGAKFEPSGLVALPTTTVAGVELSTFWKWNTTTSKWRLMGVA